MKGKALVTGATGFLGRHVVYNLLKAGYSVRCMVRATSNTSHLPTKEVEMVECSLDDTGAVQQTVKGCKLIVHCAAIHVRSHSMHDQIHKVNVEGTKALIEGTDSLDAFVYISSIRSLMNRSVSVVDENTVYDFDDIDTPYGISKFQSERLCLQYYQSHKLPLYILNPTTFIGPEDYLPSYNGKMILSHLKKKFAFVTKAMYSFADVRDVADAVLFVMEHGKKGERHIVCSANMPFEEYFHLVDKAAGQHKYYFRVPYTMLSIAGWFFEHLETIVPRFDPPVVRSSVHVARMMREFNRKKLIELGFVYRHYLDTISDAVKWLMKYHGLLVSF
jgi:dihydroflavonol-4-reductase